MSDPRPLTVVALSDTHGTQPKNLPEGDILIHVGDACNEGTVDEFSAFCAWYDSLPYRHKLFIPGNHDRCVELDPTIPERLMPSVTTLFGGAAEIDGVRIWGGPWSPDDGRWSFGTTSAGDARARWNAIPADVDLVVTHGPAAGILDSIIWKGQTLHLGCPELGAALDRVRPQAHLFGHIHEHGGAHKTVNGIQRVNVSVVDESYRLVRGAAVLQLTHMPRDTPRL